MEESPASEPRRAPGGPAARLQIAPSRSWTPRRETALPDVGQNGDELVERQVGVRRTVDGRQQGPFGRQEGDDWGRAPPPLPVGGGPARWRSTIQRLGPKRRQAKARRAPVAKASSMRRCIRARSSTSSPRPRPHRSSGLSSFRAAPPSRSAPGPFAPAAVRAPAPARPPPTGWPWDGPTRAPRPAS
jgi:hypothetical protein